MGTLMSRLALLVLAVLPQGSAAGVDTHSHPHTNVLNPHHPPACTPPGFGMWRLNLTEARQLTEAGLSRTVGELASTAPAQAYDYVWRLGGRACEPRRWVLADACTCLRGRKLHLAGHSITRGLAFQMAALLRGEDPLGTKWLPSREEQKRLCGTNSSHWVYNCVLPIDSMGVTIEFEWLGGSPHTVLSKMVAMASRNPRDWAREPQVAGEKDGMADANGRHRQLAYRPPDVLLFGDVHMRDTINVGSPARASVEGQAVLSALGKHAPIISNLSATLAELAHAQGVSHASLWLPLGPLMEELDLKPQETVTGKRALKEGMLAVANPALYGALSDVGFFRQRHVEFLDSSAMMHEAIRMERLFRATGRPLGQWYQDFIHPSPWVLRTLLDGVLSTLCPHGEFASKFLPHPHSS